MIALGLDRSAWLRPASAERAVTTWYPSSRSIRSKVSVTLGSSSTIRIVLTAAGVETARVDTRLFYLLAERYRSKKPVSIGLDRSKTPVNWGYHERHPCYSRGFVSPILVRPVREQLEHDRIIRLLQARFRRRFDVGINPGSEQNTPVGTGPTAVYPDVVLMSQDRGKKVSTVIEVETVESVNHLEALAEWATFGKLRPTFHLYVPSAMIEVAKRLCADHNIPVAEIHSYHAVGDELRFVPVYRAPSDGQHAAAAKKAVARTAAAKKAPSRG